MNREQQFKDHLRTAGERVTAPRLSVFRALLRHSPMPMSKLIVKARADGVDPVTTYRTVDLFRKLGLVQEVGMGRNRLMELSDNYQAHHHHFTCLMCGKIDDFDSSALEYELQRIGGELGAEISWHQLEITGTCAGCCRKQK